MIIVIIPNVIQAHNDNKSYEQENYGIAFYSVCNVKTCSSTKDLNPNAEVTQRDLLNHPEKKVCHRCKGSGVEKCSGCNGKGYLISIGGGRPKCTRCNGTGIIKCLHCYGKGYVTVVVKD